MTFAPRACREIKERSKNGNHPKGVPVAKLLLSTLFKLLASNGSDKPGRLKEKGINWPSCKKYLNTGHRANDDLVNAYKEAVRIEGILDVSIDPDSWEFGIRFFRHGKQPYYSLWVFINKQTGRVNNNGYTLQ